MLLVAIIYSCYAVLVGALTVRLRNRYRPIRAKGVKTIVLLVAASLVHVWGALISNDFIPGHTASCVFFSFWVQLTFGIHMWMCVLLVRLLWFHALFNKVHMRPLAIFMVAWAPSVCISTIVTVLGEDKPPECVVSLVWKGIVVGYMMGLAISIIRVIWLIRNIPRPFNESKSLSVSTAMALLFFFAGIALNMWGWREEFFIDVILMHTVFLMGLITHTVVKGVVNNERLQWIHLTEYDDVKYPINVFYDLKGPLLDRFLDYVADKDPYIAAAYGTILGWRQAKTLGSDEITQFTDKFVRAGAECCIGYPPDRLDIDNNPLVVFDLIQSWISREFVIKYFPAYKEERLQTDKEEIMKDTVDERKRVLEAGLY